VSLKVATAKRSDYTPPTLALKPTLIPDLLFEPAIYKVAATYALVWLLLTEGRYNQLFSAAINSLSPNSDDKTRAGENQTALSRSINASETAQIPF
jgi:hypothetical protein